MKRVRTEMWVLTRKGRAVRDEWGAYVMAKTKTEAEELAYKRGQEEVPLKCKLTIENFYWS